MPPADPDLHHAEAGAQLRAFVDQHRALLAASLDGLDEEEARARLVPSRTTLLGLVKHATFVEKVWFVQAVTGASRATIGIPEHPDDSFVLTQDDTIASVRASYTDAVRASRRAIEGLDLDHCLPGNRRGPLPLRWVLMHVLRELAQHCGHADILREQVLARRN